MNDFFYVYILVSQANEMIHYTVSLAILNSACTNTIEALVPTLRNIDHGELKLPLRSNLKPKRAHLKNI